MHRSIELYKHFQSKDYTHKNILTEWSTVLKHSILRVKSSIAILAATQFIFCIAQFLKIPAAIVYAASLKSLMLLCILVALVCTVETVFGLLILPHKNKSAVLAWFRNCIQLIPQELKKTNLKFKYERTLLNDLKISTSHGSFSAKYPI